MASQLLTGICSHCQLTTETYLYHGSDLTRIELCKACYDQYLAKEMVGYWKDHIAEERKRTSPSQ